MERLGLFVVLGTFVLGLMGTSTALAQSSSITYQGSLLEGGGFADGLYDMRFRLYAQANGGAALGAIILDDVEVSGGMFSVDLDFGDVYEFGSERYLDITVRPAGDPGFTVLEPRVRVTSAPSAHVAGHADTAGIAGFALDGPFAPEDTSPDSSSGASGQVVGVSANFAGTVFTDMEVSFPIRIEREVVAQGGPKSPGAGPHLDFTIKLRRVYDAGSPFYFQFQQFTGFVEIVITTGAGGTNASSFEFEGGGITGYKLDGVGSTLYEVVEVTYAQPASPVALSTYVSRSASGYTETGAGPHQPYLGGDAVDPGLYRYTVNQSSLFYSSVGAFPCESRMVQNGNPGAAEFEALSILLTVFEDSGNGLWNRFSGLQGTPFVSDLRGPGGALIWEPGFGPGSSAFFRAWALDVADDGGLYETYEFVYASDKP